MTDSVEHNKGIAKVIHELNSLDKAVGQLFCGSHTTLGLASALNKVVASIERNFRKVDYSLKKIQSLEAVSRSLILQRAKDLIEEKETKAFRTVFRIQVTMPNKKRRDKTANEFGESLMVYLGKKSDKAVIEYKKFKEALEKFTLSV